MLVKSIGLLADPLQNILRLVNSNNPRVITGDTTLRSSSLENQKLPMVNFHYKLKLILSYIFGRMLPKTSASLLIIDDLFPNPLSAFRFEEFNHYLRTFPNCEIHLTHASQLGGISSRQAIENYKHQYAALATKLKTFHRYRKAEASLAYCIFLDNAYNHISFFEKNHIPFLFTLYPGGGFNLNDACSDEKLARVVSSPYFTGVITTQSITREYLLTKLKVQSDKIHDLYGCVVPRTIKSQSRTSTTNLRIGFIANRYTTNGADKGYDLFVSTAIELCNRYPQISIDVVGNWPPDLYQASSLGKRIHFHGCLPTNELHTLYHNLDIVISPNRSDTLHNGAFDGFPTACCIEAGMEGCAIFCTDPLSLNKYFVNHSDIVLIPPSTAGIVSTLVDYIEDRNKLLQLQQTTKMRFCSIFSAENQLLPREEIISSLISKHTKNQKHNKSRTASVATPK